MSLGDLEPGREFPAIKPQQVLAALTRDGPGVSCSAVMRGQETAARRWPGQVNSIICFASLWSHHLLRNVTVKAVRGSNFVRTRDTGFSAKLAITRVLRAWTVSLDAFRSGRSKEAHLGHGC